MRLRSGQAYEFACQSKACAPPPVGSGGSKSSGGKGGTGGGGSSGDRFDEQIFREQEGRARLKAQAEAAKAARPKNIIDGVDSPHFKRRTREEVGAMTEAAARKLIMDNDATGRRILGKGVQVKHGDPIGVRANLNVKKTTGITVQTMHQGTHEQLKRGTGLFNGEAIGYGAAVTVRDAQFSVNQKARGAIMSGEKNKFPMASVDGKYVDDTRNQGMAAQSFAGVEITFNPMKNHTFVDPDGRAVKSATEVTVVGSKVYARGEIEYYTAANMPKPDRDLPTESRPFES